MAILLTVLAVVRSDPPASGGRTLTNGQPCEYTQIHMGLPVRMALYAPEPRARAAATDAFRRIAALDAMMSDYRPDSELRGIEPGRWVRVSPELYRTVAAGVRISRATGGAFDPTVAPVVALWREARRTGTRPAPDAIDRERRRTGWRQIGLDPERSAIRLGPDMRLDLGGIAKGYILHEALRVLRRHDVSRALIEAGGDIVVGNAPPDRAGWRIETPGANAAFAARAGRLTNAALATSGPTTQFVEIEGVRYSHVIDPRTGMAVTNPYVAYVIARDAAIADALATALTVLGPGAAADIRARFPGTLVSVVAH